RVVEARLGLRLPQEAPGRGDVSIEGEFQRYEASQPPIAGLIDDAHAAPAQNLEELVAIPGSYRERVVVLITRHRIADGLLTKSCLRCCQRTTPLHPLAPWLCCQE